jgi:hypothetical protein
MKPELSQQILEKLWNMKLYKNPPIGIQVFPYRQTSKQIDTKKLSLSAILWMRLNIHTERTSCDMAKVFDHVNNDETEYIIKQLGNNWEL